MCIRDSYVLYPAVFMMVTTIAALAWQTYQFFTAPDPNIFLGSTTMVLIGLAIFVAYEAMESLRGRTVIAGPMSEVPSNAE